MADVVHMNEDDDIPKTLCVVGEADGVDEKWWEEWKRFCYVFYGLPGNHKSILWDKELKQKIDLQDNK